jgi:predicted transcriptional regulator
MRNKADVRITIRLGREVADKLKQIARKRDLDLSKLARRALNCYLALGCPEEPANIPAGK